jgi:hypothetical protein
MSVSLGNCGILRAIDALFKVHYVFWVGYGKPIALFMEYLQKLVYKIDRTKLSACVRELNNSRSVLMTAVVENLIPSTSISSQ